MCIVFSLHGYYFLSFGNLVSVQDTILAKGRSGCETTLNLCKLANNGDNMSSNHSNAMI